MVHRIAALIFFCLALSVCGIAQVTSDSKDIQIAKKYLQIRARQIDSIVTVINGVSTDRMSPSAKAVYDFVTSYAPGGGGGGGHIIQDDAVTKPNRDTLNFATTSTINSVVTDAGGKSTVTHNLTQQGATTGQVLRWTGTAWVPNGLNLYDVVTTSGTVALKNNQVLINTLSAGISLNLPACNATNDGVSFQFFKAGSDSFGADIEPAGSETFNDSAATKTLFSPGTGLICTCRWTGSSGSWFYINM